MPLYTYECTNCGVVFERRQKFTDAPVKRCPECNKNKVRKVIQATGIIFKGSGWYKTDSRPSSAEGGSSSKSGKKTPAKKEDKTKEGGSSASSSPASDSASSSSDSSGSSSSGSSSSASSASSSKDD